MKKSDLKTGMIVEDNNGEFYTVMLNHASGYDILYNLNKYSLLSSFTEGLEHFYRQKTISKVFNSSLKFDEFRGELLWYRDAITEMTMDDVCKALGKTIKIVK